MATAAVVGGRVEPQFGNLRHAALSAFWFGSNFLWIPLTTLLIQTQIKEVVPAGVKNSALGLAVAIGGLLAAKFALAGEDVSVIDQGVGISEDDQADLRFVSAVESDRLATVDRCDEIAIIEESNPRLLAFQNRELDFVAVPVDLIWNVLDPGDNVPKSIVS